MRTRFHRVALLLPLAVLSLPIPSAAQWGYPAPPWQVAAAESNLRLRVTPREASVYVDGYLAGTVDEFDGQFQRLRVIPGEHELVVHMPGYRSLRQRLYLGPNTTRTVDGQLERLAPGEPDEPPPQPDAAERGATAAPDAPRDPDVPPAPRAPRRADTPPQPGAPGRPASPPMPAQARRPVAPPAVASTSRYGVLAFTVEPERATIIVDGERHDGPRGSERVLVQVPEGHHVVEVERRGYERYRVEVDVTRGQTLPLNIFLARR